MTGAVPAKDLPAPHLAERSVAWAAAGRAGVAERRGLTVKGREEPLDVVVLREDAAAVA
jgi:hypothetical protein